MLNYLFISYSSCGKSCSYVRATLFKMETAVRLKYTRKHVLTWCAHRFRHLRRILNVHLLHQLTFSDAFKANFNLLATKSTRAHQPPSEERNRFLAALMQLVKICYPRRDVKRSNS